MDSKNVNTLLLVLVIIVGLIAVAGYIKATNSSGTNVGTTSHGTLTLDQLAEIQPGLGTVMIEYGTRYNRMYQAAKAGNWGLAKYELKEATEIQEVGELTRPGKASMLKTFENTYLTPLKKAIDAKDMKAFQTAYDNGIKGCNGCHAATGHQYIKYPDVMAITTNHGSLTIDQLAEIQPGLGTIMIEYSTRFYRAYYAAKAGNWGLAKYELKEATEIQEVGELTRPGNAAKLKTFENTYLTPLDKAIDAKDMTTFQTAYDNAVKGCNNCHVATGHPYIKYVLPSTAPAIPETVTSK